MRTSLPSSLAFACTLLAGCASAPSAKDAQELFEKGDAESALRAAREALSSGKSEKQEVARARRVAIDAALALGLTGEAARNYLELDAPLKEREKLGERIADATLQVALESPDLGRRALAAGELAFAMPHPAVQVLLEKALADRESGVREAAIEAVARLQDPAASALRLARIAAEDPSPSVRGAAALALASKIGKAKANERAELAEARATVASASGRDESPTRDLAEALELMGLAKERAQLRLPPEEAPLERDETPADPELALDSPRYEERLAALHAIAARGAPADGLVPRLLRVVERDPAAPARAAAIDALALARKADLLLPTALHHADPGTRRRAFLAAERAAPFPVVSLGETLSSRDPALAPDAARLLGERGGIVALSLLLDASRDGAQPARPQAARALGVLGGPDAAAVLTASLEAKDPAVRRAAAEGLSRTSDASVREDLARGIAHGTDDTDLAAAAALLANFARSSSQGSGPAPSAEGP